MAMFKTGDVVQATDSVQGLIAGRRYDVIDVKSQWAVGSEFVTYWVRAENQPEQFPKPVANGHLILKKVQA
jgi:hypothetical protein